MTKTIFITGASSGIGKASAKLFQREGWNVIATMRSPDRERELNHLDNTLVVRLDVKDPVSIGTAVDAGIERFKGIDVLLNNAGYGAYGPLEATPTEKIRRQFDVNVIGLLETTKAVLPHFRRNRSGTIINISSVGGRIAFPFGALYHGSKFAVEGLSEALSYEMSTVGVRVKIVEPGFVNTDFGGRSFDFNNDPRLEEYQSMVGSLMEGFAELGRQRSEPDSVARVIFEAATDGTDQLRYTAGADAEDLLERRGESDDRMFMSYLRGRLGL